MSMEIEYNEGLEGVEPEHPERLIIDHFLEEVGEGNRLGAAKELRALYAAGGMMTPAEFELVAVLLEGSACRGDVFPWRLEFAKRGKGRPRHSQQNQLPAPWNAFASGDEVEAAKALRKLDALEAPDIKILAGLLDDDPTLHTHFPWRLVLKRPCPGKPRTWGTMARQFMWACLIAEVRGRHKCAKGAIGEVCDRTGLSQATVYKALKANRDKSRIR